MAVRDYVARFVSDLTGWKLEPAERAAEDLERTAEASADAVDRAWDDAARGVDDSGRKFGRTADEVARDWRDMARAADRAGDDIDDSLDETRRSGKRFAGEAGAEIGAEFSENIGEGLRSGDYKGVLLETFTSLGPALGGAGLVLGVGAAIVNGIISGVEERAAALRQAVKDAYTEALEGIDGGGNGARTLPEIIGSLTPEDIQNIRDAGLTVGQFADAVAEAEKGDTAKLDRITKALNDRAASVDSLARAVGGKGGAGAVQQAARATVDLAGTQETLDLINKGNDALRRRRDAIADLNAVIGQADLDRIRAVGGAVNAIGRDPDYQRGRR